jgi:hypothetical protein
MLTTAQQSAEIAASLRTPKTTKKAAVTHSKVQNTAQEKPLAIDTSTEYLQAKAFQDELKNGNASDLLSEVRFSFGFICWYWLSSLVSVCVCTVISFCI